MACPRWCHAIGLRSYERNKEANKQFTWKWIAELHSSSFNHMQLGYASHTWAYVCVSRVCWSHFGPTPPVFGENEFNEFFFDQQSKSCPALHLELRTFHACSSTSARHWQPHWPHNPSRHPTRCYPRGATRMIAPWSKEIMYQTTSCSMSIYQLPQLPSMIFII